MKKYLNQTQNEDLPLLDNQFKTGVTLMNFIDTIIILMRGANAI